jgi:hypothetical protein
MLVYGIHLASNAGALPPARRLPTRRSAAMSSSLLAIFEQYQKARVQFVQAVAEAATRPQNIDTMQNAGVMQLLRPLLLDNVSFPGRDAGVGRLSSVSCG